MKLFGMVAAAAVAGAVLAAAATAAAETWVDWSPGKGVTEKQYISVAPGHLDDYMTGLRKTWVPQQEIRKKHGVITDYVILLRDHRDSPDDQICLITVYPSGAAMDPDRTRDMAIESEYRAQLSKAQSDEMQAQYGTYRKRVADETWRTVEFSK
ncbi:MAG TPA: hypothetical protein VK801_10910 [Caulobacteraceae bacterium]|jgi:hypothetical protein|nr:hypothetical protein [Caulobacteraceae bacterium]